jgi:pilus assembly protein CpaB
MSRTRILILALALFAGLGAIVLVMNMQRAAQEAAPVAAAAPAREMVKVLVINRDLQIGEVAKAGDVSFVEWPKDAVSPNFITEEMDPKGTETFLGSIARVAVNKGEPVTLARMVKPGDKSFLAAILRPGFRAVALPVSGETAAGGFILPGDTVDVMLTRKIEATSGTATISRVESQVLLENVRVLAVDQAFAPPKPAEDGKPTEPVTPKIMTLELSPGDSEILAQADTLGDISLALRSLDNERNEATGTQARPGRILRQNVAAPEISEPTVRVHSYGTATDRQIQQ